MGVAQQSGAAVSPRRAQAPGISARLKSALAVRGWTRTSEPRVRFGQPLLPGLASIGADDAPLAGEFLAAARAIRDGRFLHLGHEERSAGAVEWFPAGASERWLVAHHRLDGVLPLGVAAAVGDAEERRQWYAAGVRLTVGWVDGVRVDGGAAWQLEALARRIVNLLYFHQLFAAELREDADVRRRLLASAYAQAEYLATSVPRLGGDPWLVAAGRALVVAGRFFDGLEARGWVEQGTALVWEQLRERVHEDGGEAHRSAIWQRAMLAEYLELLAVMRASNDEIPAWARKRMRGMADFLMRVSHPNGEPARFGDAPIAGLRSNQELLALAALTLGEPGLALAADLRAIYPRLVFGNGGVRVQQVSDGDPDEVSESRALRRTGFYVLAGTTGDVMILDGTTADPGRGYGAFELSVSGVPLIVGSGWADHEPWQAPFFGSPLAQNVLVEKGAGLTAPVVAPEGAVHWMLRDGLVSFLATWGDRRRLVLCLPGRFWLVIDQVNGSGPWAGESLLHLDPACRVQAICQGRPTLMLWRPPAARAALAFAGASEVRLAGGVKSPRVQGWMARTAGGVEPAQVVVLPVQGARPLACGYAIVPRGTPDVALTVEAEALEVRATLRIARTEYRLHVLQNEIELRSGVA